MIAISEFEQARRKYKPDKIKCLFIAESPPAIGSGRFFYFEDVWEKDSLFIEMMKVLYLDPTPNIPQVRYYKRTYLQRFMDDGFYLIDSIDEPIGITGTAVKKRRIRQELPTLKEKVNKLVGTETPIILISRPVYDATVGFLRSSGFNVINKEMIDFPGSSGQKRFRVKMDRLLTIRRIQR